MLSQEAKAKRARGVNKGMKMEFHTLLGHSVSAQIHFEKCD